jgi:MFS family permease
MKERTYQNTIVTLFALTWGFVLLDRNAISFLFPVLMKNFNLNNAQTGNIVMVTGLGFVISSLFLTPLADRSGKKKVWLVPVIILAGIFSGSTAVSGSLIMMFIVRFLTGLADGPVYPLMTSMLKVQGDPKRFATYIGILQFSIGLIAMVLGPTLTIQLAVHMNWQYAFIFTSLPTVILGIIIWFVLKENAQSLTGEGIADPSVTLPLKDDSMRWRDVPRIFTYKNCTLSYIANVLIMVGLWGVVSFGTTYWVNEGGLTIEETGYMTSASGIVGLIWALFIPVMADRLGRRVSALILTLYIALSMFIIYFNQGMLARIVFVLVVGCCGFVSVLYVAIICQESVPSAIAATTTAIGMAIGELIGTTIAPHILGTMGDLYGLKTVFLVAAVCAMVAFFISFGITETGKRR